MSMYGLFTAYARGLRHGLFTVYNQFSSGSFLIKAWQGLRALPRNIKMSTIGKLFTKNLPCQMYWSSQAQLLDYTLVVLFDIRCHIILIAKLFNHNQVAFYIKV